MAQQFMPNTMPPRALAAAPADLMRDALDEMLQRLPPKDAYQPGELGGLMYGPTGAAYLLLQMSARHPGLSSHNHDLAYWARRYVDADRGDLVLSDGRAGVLGEELSFHAVRACVSKQADHVSALLDEMAALLEPRVEGAAERFPAELIYGRAGALYLLRMVRHWVPESAGRVDAVMQKLAQRTLDMDDDGKGHWLYQGNRCLGAAHGDVGIIVQVVLSAPSLAPRLSGILEELLDLQAPDGNWLQTDCRAHGHDKGQVQFCHGAPGFIYALQALRQHFPRLQARIDSAIERARGAVWSRGMLTKEPSLCHGLFGNGLVLAKGPQRDHFLAHATPEAVEEARKKDAAMFQPAHYGSALTVMAYWPSAVWTWSVCEEQEPPLIPFTDV